MYIPPPAISFTSWKRWKDRSRLQDEFDVPHDFDFAGIYMLARFDTSEETSLPTGAANHLSGAVIYVGQSKHLTRRVQYHDVAKKYRRHYDDERCTQLYFATCHFGHGWYASDLSREPIGGAKRAYLHFAERKLIWEYANAYGRVPALNRY